MRTLSGQESKILQSLTYSVSLRVEIKDHAGAWVDLSNLRGYDWIRKVTIAAKTDDQVATSTITLIRNMHALSLASLMGGSLFNTGGPLVEIGREIRVYTATTGQGRTPDAADWKMVFHGFVDKVDWGDDEVTVDCRDLGARLQKTIARIERAYGGTADLPRPYEFIMQDILDDNTTGEAWRASTVYYIGDQVRADVGGNTYVFRATAFSGSTYKGATGSSPPSWAVGSPGMTTVDGTITWTNLGNWTTLREILNVPFPTLQALGAKATTERKSIMDMVKDFADTNGWALNYKFDDGAGDFRLTFYDPQRNRTDEQFTFGPDAYLEVKKCARDIATTRSTVQVTYPDPGSPDSQGKATRKTVRAYDATSAALYGDQFFEINEKDTSQIDKESLALIMAGNVLSDIKDPRVDLEVELPYFWPAELTDLYKFTGNGIHFDSDQKLAVIDYEHEISPEKIRTKLSLRGKPVSNFENWFLKAARPGQGGTIPFSSTDAPTMGVPAYVAGLNALFPIYPPKGSLGVNRFKTIIAYEIYVSHDGAFVPDASTLYTTVRADQVLISGYNVYDTYYVKAIAIDIDGNRSAASAAYPFVPPSGILSVGQNNGQGIPFTYNSGGMYDVNSKDHTAHYWKAPGGTDVTLDGTLKLTTPMYVTVYPWNASEVNNTTLFALPAGYRPSVEQIIPISARDGTGLVTGFNVTIRTSGKVQITNPPGGTFTLGSGTLIDLSEVTFPV